MSPPSEIITRDRRLYHLGIAPTDVAEAIHHAAGGSPARTHPQGSVAETRDTLHT